jgi:inner membrane protein
MEPVTHFLTGACLGRSGFNRKTAYATLAMTLAAEAADLDMVWGFRGPVAELQHHRGWTHTLVGAPVVALAIVAFVWVLHRIRKKKPVVPVRWGWLGFCALIAALSHILLDYTVNYGVRPFFPFDPRWHAWSIVFIVDPWILVALMLAVVIPGILGLADREIGARKKPFRGRGWAIAGLTFTVLWWGMRNAEHGHALELVRTGHYTREPLIRAAAEPHILDPFRWRAILETEDRRSGGDRRLRGRDLQDAGDAGRGGGEGVVSGAGVSGLGEVGGGGGSGDGARAGGRCAATGMAHGGVPGFAVWVSADGVNGANTGRLGLRGTAKRD